MKIQWKRPELETMNFQNTNENIVDCPMDVEAAVMKADCPINNNPNNEDKMCNYPGCNHKRHKKSILEGRCKCHERLELPTS